jgi:hypothetical protein
VTAPATGELVRTLAAAAAFVDRVGLALIFPKEGVALPSLYEAVAGASPAQVADELEDGSPWHTPEMSMVWRWKDELGQAGLACAGKHVKGLPSLVSLRLLPSLYALTGRSGAADDFRDAVLPPVEREVAEAVLDAAPADSRDIRRAVGRRDTATVNRAIDSLQRRLVITRAGTVERERGWPGSTYDVLARRHPLGRLPPPDEAAAQVAAAVLETAGELSAADLARALGTSRAESAAALDRLAAEGRATVDRDGRAAVWRAVASPREPAQ